MPVSDVTVKEGKTTSGPSTIPEDTVLAAMEGAGVKEAPEDAERKGLGTPATRAATIESWSPPALSSVRRPRKRSISFRQIPAYRSLLSLPEQLQSPLLTAEWEHKLKQSIAASWKRCFSGRYHRAEMRSLPRHIRSSRARKSCFPSVGGRR
jgi:DNA topoisomerase-3